MPFGGTGRAILLRAAEDVLFLPPFGEYSTAAFAADVVIPLINAELNP